MKKIFLMASAAALLFSSCGDLDINESPNNPSGGNVTANLIMPSVENCVATITGDGLYNIAGFLTQYFEQATIANQYNDIIWYNIQPSSQLVDRSYAMAYANALQDIEEIKGKTSNTADLFAATVLRAYTLQMLVDATGETPYSEALKGSGISKPHYDNGEDVYAGVLKEMDDAEAALNPEDLMETNDLLLDKDLDQWKGFANALRLRMYLRMISGNIDAANYTAKLKTLVSEGNFFTGDIAFDAYSDEANKRNPWYETNAMGLTGNHCVAYPLISYLEATGDPRISYGISKAEATQTYVGQIPGGKTETRRVLGNANLWMNKHVSGIDYTVGATKPVCFFTQAELQFLKAEVFLKYLNNDAAAETAFNAGIDADFAVRGVKRNSTFNNNVMWNGTTDEKLRLIYMQKWVALFYMDHMEAWSEARRTDCPSFSDQTAAYIFEHREDNASLYNAGDFIYPWTNDLGDRRAVKRIFYPLDAVLYNPNAPESPELDTPVWWDK